jgi:medium-chain acyl-CoA ligase, mitochondrial
MFSFFSFFLGIRLDQGNYHAKILVNTPFFHVAGLTALMHCVTLGSTLILPTPHFNGEMSLKAHVKEQCNTIYGTPNMYIDMIVKQKEFKLDLPTSENAVIGAAVVPSKLVQDAKKYLNIKTIRCNFGMTETSCLGFGSISGEDESLKFDTVGKLADHAEAKIIDKDGNVVPIGESGELCLRGYFNMLGYYGDEVKTREVLSEDGWLKTGDQFILTKDGYGKIIGRLKEMMIRGGENIFPREIEDFLHSHPNIQEVHVVSFFSFVHILQIFFILISLLI